MILQVEKIIKDPSPPKNIGHLLQNHIKNHIRETNWEPILQNTPLEFRKIIFQTTIFSFFGDDPHYTTYDTWEPILQVSHGPIQTAPTAAGFAVCHPMWYAPLRWENLLVVVPPSGVFAGCIPWAVLQVWCLRKIENLFVYMQMNMLSCI